MNMVNNNYLYKYVLININKDKLNNYKFTCQTEILYEIYLTSIATYTLL